MADPRQGSPAAPSPGVGRVLLALTLVALMLRVFRLDAGLWIDEVYSLLDTFRRPLPELLTTYVSDNQHPLYAVAARLSLLLFGESTWAIRLPAMLFGVASVPALYALGREVAGVREGLLAAALLAVSYHHVWFSQNARGYTALAFLAIVATWCLLRALRTGRREYAVVYALAAGLGAYTHLTMVLLAVAQSVVAVGTVVRPPRGWRPGWPVVFIAFLGGAAATLALYAPVLPQVVDYFVDSPSRFVGVSTRSWAFLETLRQLQVGFGATAGAAVALTCFVGGAWRFFRRSPVAFGLFAFPAVAVILGAALARGTMYPRFFFFMAGFAVLFLIEGAFWTASVLARTVGPLRGREVALGTGFVAVLIVGSVASLPFNYRLPKQDFDGARAYVLERRAPDEPVFVLGAAIRPMREVAGMPWEGVQSAERLDEVTDEGGVWLVYAMPRLTAETLPDVWSILQRACPEPTVFPGTVGDGEVLVCRTADGAP